MKIIQLSDTHFFADPASNLWQVANPYQNFLKVLTVIKNAVEPPDVLLLTGDLSQDDSVSSYAQLVSHIDSLQIPTYFIPGNHDNLSVLHHTFSGKFIKNDKLIQLNDWALILLDSTKENWTAGNLSQQQLDFLAESLQKTKQQQVMVVLHHHPVLLDSPVIDQYILQNREEFLQLLLPYENVKAILFGHVHQVVDLQYKHIRILGCPATSIQFLPRAVSFTVDPEPPGFRWLELQNENFLTGITRVE